MQGMIIKQKQQPAQFRKSDVGFYNYIMQFNDEGIVKGD